MLARCERFGILSHFPVRMESFVAFEGLRNGTPEVVRRGVPVRQAEVRHHQ
jgi:hypothetical protein